MKTAFLSNFSGNDEMSDDQSASVVNVVASASSTNVHSDSTNAMDVDVIVRVPFALVDEIADASPAGEDGLQLGDQIVKFGNVEIGDNLLQRLASEAQTNQGHGIPVILVRQGAQVNLTVTPRTWQGRGLLGYDSFLFFFFFDELTNCYNSFVRHLLKFLNRAFEGHKIPGISLNFCDVHHSMDICLKEERDFSQNIYLIAFCSKLPLFVNLH